VPATETFPDAGLRIASPQWRHILLIVDERGEVRGCGESLARLLGRTADEVAGQFVWGLLPGWTPFEHVRRNGKTRLRLAERKSSVPVRLSCKAVYAGSETLFILDVRRLSGESAPEAVMVTDRRGTILNANCSCELVTGFSCADLVGRTPSVLRSGPNDARTYRELLETVLDGRVYRGTLVNRRKNGELYREFRVIRPVRDAQGRPVLLLSSGRELVSSPSDMWFSGTRGAHSREFPGIPMARMVCP
jgi:PAS domain S-box-containing protein